MKKLMNLVIAGLLICTFLISCSFTAKKGDDGIYAFQAYNTEDEQIRYIMTEIQLEGTLSFEGFGGYGRQTSQVWNQASDLWNQGVRVVNIDRFYRSTKPGTIMVNGVPVVISGIVYDYETAAVLNPRDVILTTDLQPTIEIPASTLAPENTQVPTVRVSENFCDNPWWPIREGAYWIFNQNNCISTIETKISIQDIISDGNQTTFTLAQEGGNGGFSDNTYSCTRDGVFGRSGDLILPFYVEFQQNAVYEANGKQVTASKVGQFDVPAGSFNGVRLWYWSAQYTFGFSFSQGVGPVEWTFSATDCGAQLKSYYIP